MYFEYIGPRDALLRLPCVRPDMFEVGRSGVKKKYDDHGGKVEVHRYANDMWRLWFCVHGPAYWKSTDPDLDREEKGLLNIDVAPLLERFVSGPREQS